MFLRGIRFSMSAMQLTPMKMSDILYIIAIILIIGWLLGFFVFSLGSLIHVLIVFAVIAILFRLIRGRRL